MFRKITCYLVACLFLSGSVILPLGDFSLLRDLPRMYDNYTKITSAEEMGVIDFIGDYLLHGKEIFGNNEHDKTPANGNAVQFQHLASPLSVVFQHQAVNLHLAPVLIITHISFYQPYYTSGYRNELLRPPLA